MQILVYCALTLAVCFIACFHRNSQNGDNPDTDSKQSGLVVKGKVPWINLLLISTICAAYSRFLGIQEGLSDRINYAYSFLYRYPYYYTSLGSLSKANTEPGYVLLNMIIGKFTKDPNWLFFCTVFLTTMINLYVISKISSQYKSVVLLTMLSMFFFQSTYLLRQALAVAFCNLAVMNFLEGKKFRYFLLSAAAALFHVTAIIMLPLYFLFKYSKSNKVYLSVFLGFAALFILFVPFFSAIVPKIPFLGQYIAVEDLVYARGGGSISSVLKGLPFYIITLLSLLNRKTLVRKTKYADLLIVSSVIYSMCWILNYNMYWFFRFGWYLMLPTLLLIVELLGSITNRKERLFVGSVIGLSLMIITCRQILIILY